MGLSGRNGNWAFMSLFLSHGLTAVVTVYLAVRGGAWLDQRLGTSPLALVVLVVLVVGANLHLLVKDMLMEAEKQDRARRRPPGGGGRAPGQTTPTDDRGGSRE